MITSPNATSSRRPSVPRSFQAARRAAVPEDLRSAFSSASIFVLPGHRQTYLLGQRPLTAARSESHVGRLHDLALPVKAGCWAAGHRQMPR